MDKIVKTRGAETKSQLLSAIEKFSNLVFYSELHSGGTVVKKLDSGMIEIAVIATFKAGKLGSISNDAQKKLKEARKQKLRLV